MLTSSIDALAIMMTGPEDRYVITTWPWASMTPTDVGSPPTTANPTSSRGSAVGLIIPDAHSHMTPGNY
jgi:hypothetical protein